MRPLENAALKPLTGWPFDAYNGQNSLEYQDKDFQIPDKTTSTICLLIILLIIL